MYRRDSRQLKLGNILIGGGAPISVQSMTNTKTENVEATVKQINELTAIGCDVIRCAVPDFKAAQALSAIKEQISIPLIADIHFDYKLALEAIASGVDGLRLNPGNIGGEEEVSQVIAKASDRNIPRARSRFSDR